MCSRYVLKREDLEKLAKDFQVRTLDFHSRYNIAPSSIVPVLRKRGGEAAELTGVRWGLIPAWAKADAPVKPLINVRSETLVTRFKGAMKSRRCVLPASGFYEWQAVGSRKQPWYFAARDGGALGLAGIWDTWRGAEGVELETCGVLTTAPNAVLTLVHDRMPVLLTAEQCHTWLEEQDSAKLESLLTSAADDAIVALRVASTVSNPRNEGPECLAPASDEPPEPQLALGL
jgi:putative SOS response-associated peptidase YedK